MKDRIIGRKVLEFAKSYPVVTITGPRQSGKTTLAKVLFPGYRYVNLESLGGTHSYALVAYRRGRHGVPSLLNVRQAL